MTVDNLEQRLKAMQGAFKEADMDAPGQGPMPPDGKYQALIHEFDFFESNAGQAFLKTRLQIALNPDWDGTIVETVHNLEDPERIGWAKSHLAALGINVEELDLGSLMGELEKVLDAPVEIQIKRSAKKNPDTGQPYVNVYVNQRVGDPMPKPDVPVDTKGLEGKQEEFAGAAAGGDRKTDDIPF